MASVTTSIFQGFPAFAPPTPSVSDDLRALLAGTEGDMRLGASECGACDHVAAYDVMRAAGFKSGYASKLARFTASVADADVRTLPVYARWSSSTHVVGVANTNASGAATCASGAGASFAMLSANNARRLVCFLLKRSNRSQAEIDATVRAFGIEAKVFESAFAATAERDTLAAIARAIPYPSVEQFAVGRFKVDLYFPDVKIAVECNEHDHADYPLDQELARRRFIERQLGCRTVTFDPYAARFNVLDVVRRVVELLVCDDFRAWNLAVSRGPWGASTERE